MFRIEKDKVEKISKVLADANIECDVNIDRGLIIIDLDDEHTAAADELILAGAFYAHAFNRWIAYI